MKKYDVFGLGNALVDCVCLVDDKFVFAIPVSGNVDLTSCSTTFTVNAGLGACNPV